MYVWNKNRKKAQIFENNRKTWLLWYGPSRVTRTLRISLDAQKHDERHYHHSSIFTFSFDLIFYTTRLLFWEKLQYWVLALHIFDVLLISSKALQKPWRLTDMTTFIISSQTIIDWHHWTYMTELNFFCLVSVLKA